MQDSKIVESVLGGDVETYELLVLKYQKALFYAAYNIVKSAEAAEDIVQDAFVKAYESLASLRDYSEFYSWIKRIAVNMAINYYNRAKWHVDMTSDDDSDYDFFDNVPTLDTPEQKLLQEELGVYLQACIDELPDRLRLVFVMRELEELSYEEIAELLSIPVGTVRSRLFHARKVLKEQLIARGLADGVYEPSAGADLS